MEDWLLKSFGRTLCDIFFFPFHRSYTNGLYRHIAPQDNYKSPQDMARIVQGASREIAAAGYNVTFRYPCDGLDSLVDSLASQCRVECGKTVVALDTRNKIVRLKDASAIRYKHLIATTPLPKTLEMCGIPLAGGTPYTSVLVLNIAAARGPLCPDWHWLYVVGSKSGFHRIGFYSNVDLSFLPREFRDGSKVSLYIEKAYLGGKKPNDAEISTYTDLSIEELQSWGYLGAIDCLDVTWVEFAYTWLWPDSNWRADALQILESRGVLPVGRYGRWGFQGIAESIRDGLRAGARFT
jgi:protoporphyrinogen oxidase